MSTKAGRRRVAWIGKWIAAVGFFHSLGGFFMFFPDAWATIIDVDSSPASLKRN